jgi:hypothetical protein
MTPQEAMVGLPEAKREALRKIIVKLQTGKIITEADVGCIGMSVAEACEDVSRNELARIFQCLPNAPVGWVNDGCPRLPNRNFNLAAVIDWKILRASQPKNKEKIKLSEQKTQAEIDLLRAKIATIQETTILKSEHIDKMVTFARNIKEYFLNGARRVAHEFIGCQDSGEAQDKIIQFITHGVNSFPINKNV